MSEYFEKYLDAKRLDTNATIDNPVIFIAGYTKKELFAGMIIFFIAMYFLNVSVYLSLIMLPFSVITTKYMREIRETTKPKFLSHRFWYTGQLSHLPKHIKLPKKFYFTR